MITSRGLGGPGDVVVGESIVMLQPMYPDAFLAEKARAFQATHPQPGAL